MVTICALLSLASMVALCLSLFIPRKTAFFMREPSRTKAVLLYLVILLVSSGIFNALSPKPPASPAPAAQSAETASASKPDDPHKQPPPADKALQEEMLATYTKDFADWYERLLSFKNDPDFYTYGFSNNGPYGYWLKEAKKRRDETPNWLALQTELIYGNLMAMGLGYMKGREDDATRWHRETIERKLQEYGLLP